MLLYVEIGQFNIQNEYRNSSGYVGNANVKMCSISILTFGTDLTFWSSLLPNNATKEIIVVLLLKA